MFIRWWQILLLFKVSSFVKSPICNKHHANCRLTNFPSYLFPAAAPAPGTPGSSSSRGRRSCWAWRRSTWSRHWRNTTSRSRRMTPPDTPPDPRAGSHYTRNLKQTRDETVRWNLVKTWLECERKNPNNAIWCENTFHAQEKTGSKYYFDLWSFLWKGNNMRKTI